MNKPYKCIKCSTQFKDLKEAKDHFDTAHYDKNIFKCKICEVRFTEDEALKNHCTLVHEGQKPFNCAICGNHFKLEKNLNIHIGRVHDKGQFFSKDSAYPKLTEQKKYTLKMAFFGLFKAGFVVYQA